MTEGRSKNVLVLGTFFSVHFYAHFLCIFWGLRTPSCFSDRIASSVGEPTAVGCTLQAGTSGYVNFWLSGRAWSGLVAGGAWLQGQTDGTGRLTVTIVSCDTNMPEFETKGANGQLQGRPPPFLFIFNKIHPNINKYIHRRENSQDLLNNKPNNLIWHPGRNVKFAFFEILN